MDLGVKQVSHPGWKPLDQEGCHGVEVKGLLRGDSLNLAMLRISRNATIHEHPADINVDVICLEGRGNTSVGDAVAELRADETIRWPAGVPHRLWTEDSEMVTLMVEWRAPAAGH